MRSLDRRQVLAGLGTVGELSERPEGGHEAWFAYTDNTSPVAVYRYDARGGQVELWERAPGSVDVPDVETRQVAYESADGTTVRMLIISGRQQQSEPRPAILTGYGGFNTSALPGFVSSRSSWGAHAVWLEHGGMIAVPNLRGGGEYGEAWHKAGMLLAKQHVFDDFLAAARWLASSGWTSPDHLAISGGSNGGLLMGAAITQGPELFKAVICEVPLLDMVRYHLSGSGKTWMPEYGSADDRAQFEALYAYSPYHRVTQGVRYPAVLMSSADHDDRVDPMHARKFAALLQWATGSDAPVWLRIQTNAGHGGVDVVKQKIEQNADTYAFLMWQLGMK
jgi:prolyl oligopeptidase